MKKQKRDYNYIITPKKSNKNSPYNPNSRLQGLFIYFNDIITLKGGRYAIPYIY